MSEKSFADLGVSRPVAGALAERGITEPFPVQRLVIEDVLSGEDVLVQSPTGSGKTLAFGVPIVDRTAADARRPSCLILAPTRELACQIVDEIETIARVRALKIAVVYGGVAIGPQIKHAPRSHILVATPGRLEDLLDRRAVTLDHIRTLVLDEADRMLDMGFKPAVDRIVRQVPAQRQTLFFSATLEGDAGRVAATYTTNPRRHVQAPEPIHQRAISHRFVGVDSQAAKLDALMHELRSHNRGRTLVFVRTKHGADRLVKRLGREDLRAAAMHGNKSQSQRQKALARFERGEVDTLVATDVAARGIDVAEITHVINYDAPEDRDTYTHRVGRTGRAGARGEGVSFVLADQHREMHKIARELDLEFDLPVPKGAAAGHGSRSHNGRGGGGPKQQRPSRTVAQARSSRRPRQGRGARGR
jgi:superfamily II DNA/RNA helicase